jgi:hypothetical protein
VNDLRTIGAAKPASAKARTSTKNSFIAISVGFNTNVSRLDVSEGDQDRLARQ